MAQDLKKMIARLNDLIALDHDAVGAYAAAIKRLDVMFLKERLAEFQADHQRHIAELSAVVTRLGGEATTKPDLKGVLLKGFTAATSAMGTEAALRAMQGNEKLTNRAYEKALLDTWPSDIEAIIRKNLTDEQRHLSFIEMALQNRAWEERSMNP